MDGKAPFQGHDMKRNDIEREKRRDFPIVFIHNET